MVLRYGVIWSLNFLLWSGVVAITPHGCAWFQELTVRWNKSVLLPHCLTVTSAVLLLSVVLTPWEGYKYTIIKLEYSDIVKPEFIRKN